MMIKEIGKTKDTGYQVGTRQTVDMAHPDAWALMFSPDGLRLWLGEIDPDSIGVGSTYSFENGTNVEVSVFKLLSHIRMKWKKAEWKNTSRLQLRVIESGSKSVISFHQEILENPEQRQEMKDHWKTVLGEIERYARAHETVGS